MIACKLATFVIMAAACVVAVGHDAQARSEFDGLWSVTVSGQNGACQGGSYQYAIQIVDGIIRYPGSDARITGRVSPKGAVYVRVSASDQNAMGSGRLSRDIGSGSFRGQSSSSFCAGIWRAQRTGR